MHQQVSLIKGN